MDKTPSEKGWFYIHWTMYDNPIMTQEQIDRAAKIYPIGSYYHTIKIKGERGSPGKMVYLEYLDSTKHIKPLEVRNYNQFVVGVDIGQNKAFNSFTLFGVSANYQRCGVLDKDTFKQLGYKDKKERLIAYIRLWRSRGANIIAVSVDSAEQNFIKDLKTEFLTLGLPEVIPSYKATIKERIDAIIVLLSADRLHFNNTQEGKDAYDSFMIAKWEEGKEGLVREDKNERHNDVIDSVEYAMTVFMARLLYAYKLEGVA
jgi:hypothetical protein